MNLFNYKTIVLLLLLACCIGCQAINLESISEKKRNKLLFPIAKEVVMRYGPDFYREDPKPKIGRALRTKSYKVVYSAKLGEIFELGDAASVYCDNDTGLPSSVTFGNGIGLIINDVFKSYIAQKYYGKRNFKGVDYKKLVDQEVVTPIVYQTILKVPHIRLNM